MWPKRAMAAWTAAGGSPGSARSSAVTSVAAPSAAASRAVSSRVPGSGSVAERRMVDECSRRSAPVTVRAVSTRSKPRRASSSAQPRPMPRLAPVMNATLRSDIVLPSAAGPQPLDLASRDAPSARSAHQLVVVAHAHRARAAVGQPVLRRAVGVAPGAVAVDLDVVGGDRVPRRLVPAHGIAERAQRVGDRPGSQRPAIGGVAGEARRHEAGVAGVHAAGVAQQELADGGAVVDLLHVTMVLTRRRDVRQVRFIVVAMGSGGGIRLWFRAPLPP